MNKDEIFNAILEKEGGYVNHPDDKGGPTNWGITQVTARAHGYDGDMQKLTRQQALDILNADYWIAPRFDHVAEISTAIAEKLCDAGVNMGPVLPGKWLQPPTAFMKRLFAKCAKWCISLAARFTLTART